MESSKIAAIYSKSYLNLAAMGLSDSSHSLFSLRWIELPPALGGASPVIEAKVEGNSQGRYFEAFVRLEQWRIHRDLWRETSATRMDFRSPLPPKAWGFQELCLSTRKGHFRSSELIWERRDSKRCECMVFEWIRDVQADELSRTRQAVLDQTTRSERDLWPLALCRQRLLSAQFDIRIWWIACSFRACKSFSEPGDRHICSWDAEKWSCKIYAMGLG